MTFRTMSLPLAALVAGAAPSLAQIAPEDVWAEMVDGLERGQLVLESADESREGDVLTVSNIEVSQDDGFTATTFTLPQIVMRQTDEGVALELPETSEITFSSRSEYSEEPTTGTLVLDLDGWTANLTGQDIESLDYDYAADAVTVTVSEIDVPDEGTFEAPMTMTMTDLSGDYSTEPAEDGLDRISQTARIGSTEISVDMDATDPVATFDLAMNLGSLEFEATSFVDSDLEPEDFQDALASGFSGEGSATLGPYDYTFEFYEEDTDASRPADQFSFSGGSEGGEAAFAISADGMSYSTESTAVRLAVETPELPVGAVSGTLDRVALSLTAPTVSSEEAQDFSAELRMEGLALSDSVWDMLPDMVGAPIDLPRDPATIAIALTGQVILPFDYFDSALYEQSQQPEPPLPTTVTLDELRIDFAGVELTGDGTVDFDLDDMESFDGFPAPDGTIELSLTGLQGLVRTLVQAGLVPAEQALFVQGMVGAVARPVGEDQFVSEIVFGPGASITANGFPIPLR
ncbi:uncharacterized protein DUF2125 [Hasllibacter halocynthiae]|uniref:Uncharacterized protein DUF2125 n=1 Tax=Hasllibacter halocynthiae TaxID=595589 RepID=A0A2T0X1H1_9RHOB|nr:DUF2125 domain-containing protein [Hasllibacter halocynthiae]PRY92792.1 uncharacterized protein DUF2125 [Hasllibacter halocynthiae]